MSHIDLKILKESFEQKMAEHHGGKYPQEVMNLPLSAVLDYMKVKNSELYKSVESFIETEIIARHVKAPRKKMTHPDAEKWQ